MFAIVCLILSMLIYFGYMAYVYCKYQPDTISKSYYLIHNRNVFSVWIISVAVMLLPAWLEISSADVTFLPFLSVIALCIVGICPKYLEQDRTIHITAVLAACVLSLIWNGVSETFAIPLVLAIPAILLCVCSVKDKWYWLESLCFTNIYLAVILKLISA